MLKVVENWRFVSILLTNLEILDLARKADCNLIDPPADRAVTIESPPWTVTGNGYLINVSPHLHDGALNIKLFRNGELVCTSKAVYGGGAGAELNGEKWETITSYEECSNPVKIKKGDTLKMTADYDLTKHRL